MFNRMGRRGNYGYGFALPHDLNLFARFIPFQHVEEIQTYFRDCRCFHTLAACSIEERVSICIAPDGSIRVIELVEKEMPVVRAQKVNGRWMGAEVQLDRAKVINTIRADREGR